MIVIFGILFLTITPVVLRIMDNVKKDFALASLNVVKVSAEYYYMKSISDHPERDFAPFTCGYGKSIDPSNGIFSCNQNIKVTGMEPTSGILHIATNGNITFQGPLMMQGYACKYALSAFTCDTVF